LVDILKLNVQNIFLGYWVSNVAPYIMNIWNLSKKLGVQ
jgi:hypothetical protein